MKGKKGLLLPLAELVSAERVSAVSICAMAAACVGTVTLTPRAVYGAQFYPEPPILPKGGFQVSSLFSYLSLSCSCASTLVRWEEKVSKGDTGRAWEGFVLVG